jgi:1,4-alpha-glucan branching enzyme
MTKNSFGIWNVTVPAKNGVAAIPHDSKIKVSTSALWIIEQTH